MHNIINSIKVFLDQYSLNHVIINLYDTYIPLYVRFYTDIPVSILSTSSQTIALNLVNLNMFSYNLISSSEFIIWWGFSEVMVNALLMALKFLACISLLIFARGGIPRFRFDYLTKLGWIRFLSLVLLALLVQILLLSMI